jgi:hypothetical protein
MHISTMPSDVLHPAAYFRDSFGVRHEIKAADLNDDQVLERAKLNLLTDYDDQVQLFPRTPKDAKPHFFQKGEPSGKVYSGERDRTHDLRVRRLATALSGFSGPWKLAFGPNSSSVAQSELQLPKYSWEEEVVRAVEVRTLVRHDIFGADLTLSMSYLRPTVAIEVIHTHYPEEAAFQGMLSQSARAPYGVFFDHTRRPNTFVKVDTNEQQLIYSRWTFHIKDGTVHQGHQARPDIRTSAALQMALDGLIDDWDRFRSSRNERTT